MRPEAPLKVLFASVAAGGGHNSVRDAMVRAVEAVDAGHRQVLPLSWTATSGFDGFYRWAVRIGVQGVIFALTASSISPWLAVLTNVPMLRESIAVLRREKPDAVVSTHLVLTCCFLIARWWTKLPARVVSIIPDYGSPTPGFFPRFAALRADATFVNGEDTLAHLQRLSTTRPGEVHLLGTLVDPSFLEVGEEVRANGGRTPVLRARWRAELAVMHAEAHAIDPALPTVAFYGGSGFSGKALPVIEELLAREDAGKTFNLVVLCGRDEALKRRLVAHNGQKPGVAFLGFLQHPMLARLYALTDVPVLGSIAHSSLQELLETGVGPLLVFHCIPGTEPPYVDYLTRMNLGTFEPDVPKMTALCEAALGLGRSARWGALADGFLERAWSVRAASRARAVLVVEQLRRITGRQALEVGSVAPGAEAASAYAARERDAGS